MYDGNSSFWRNSGAYAIALLILLTSPIPLYSYDENDGTFSATERRVKFLEAKPGRDKGIAARRLLSGRTPQEIQSLCVDDDPSIALCAAWHRLQVQMQAQILGPDRGATHVPIPDSLTREFLGFVEGRLRVPPPDHWATALQVSRYSRWGSNSFRVTPPTVRTIAALQSGRVEFNERSSLPQVMLSLKSSPPYATFLGRESYEGQEEVANFPDELVKALKEAEQSGMEFVITGIAADGKAVIALPGDGPGESEMICFPVKRNSEIPKVLWRYQMDSYGADGFKGSSWYTEFRLGQENLYLFHFTDDSIGIECVQVSKGVRVFSFNSRLP